MLLAKLDNEVIFKESIRQSGGFQGVCEGYYGRGHGYESNDD